MWHRFIENELRSTLSYPNETSKECIQFLNKCTRRRGRSRMEVGVTPVYLIYAYHVFDSRRWPDVLGYSINKSDIHDIAEILMK